ncbi:hypothetical protein FIBSPDRAFT_911537 [Athelia psychrophila]|uniref:Lytic polysaccharide monooxygenase n=1 Tax=Athelia psychrophila TaxID=1759441 RepID=A0A166HJQ4_9AGAM|nr:hypothetical protein FIBSPDRAFT_911537 [Fibularhizoctonia sp. CBS 109695]
MVLSSLSFLLLCAPSLVYAQHDPRAQPPSPLSARGETNGYYDVTANGGSMLTQVNNTYPPGQSEPVNVILAGTSDSAVLVDQSNDGGLRNWYLSIGFSSECLGQHEGSDQAVDLGDGHGYQLTRVSGNETAVIRWDYGDPSLGTCKETIQGGNHFRYWVQDGPNANSGAVFMALSYEEPIASADWFIGNATAQGSLINSTTLTNTSTFSGSTQYGGYTYQNTIQYISGLLPNTSEGINHNITVGVNGASACDGLVALIDVKITSKPAGSS